MSKCPHNTKLHCACLEAKDPKNFACVKCHVYQKHIMEKEQPINGYKALGCLFVGICILVVVGLTAFELVKRITP